MIYLKTYESFDNFEFYINEIKDIFTEIQDEKNFVVKFSKIKNKFVVKVKKSTNNDFNGGISSYEFIWGDIKETIYRLLDYYYEIIPNGNIDFFNVNSSYSLEKGKFAKGFKSEEDFEKDIWIGDYTRFNEIKIIIDL